MRLNLGTSVPESYRFMGSKGIMDISGSQIEFTPQAGKDEEPSWYAGSFPYLQCDAYYREWRREHDPAIGHEPIAESVIYRGTQYDELKPHLWTFFQAVKSRQPVTENAVFGHHAALACHMANQSYFRKSAVIWDENSNTIKS